LHQLRSLDHSANVQGRNFSYSARNAFLISIDTHEGESGTWVVIAVQKAAATEPLDKLALGENELQAIAAPDEPTKTGPTQPSDCANREFPRSVFLAFASLNYAFPIKTAGEPK
jgi:hypothetical protein